MSVLDWAAGLTPLAALSAEQMLETWRNHGPASQERSMQTLIWAAILVLVAILVWLIILRQRERRRPYLLFYELSVLHTIGRATERRLLHLARTHRLDDPALLFVCPELVSELKSLETAEAKTDGERRRVENFFESFTAKVFG